MFGGPRPGASPSHVLIGFISAPPIIHKNEQKQKEQSFANRGHESRGVRRGEDYR
jgi:hypothetical protein